MNGYNYLERGDRIQTLPEPYFAIPLSATDSVSSPSSWRETSEFDSPSSFQNNRGVRRFPPLRSLPNFAMECDRYCVSDRVAAVLASSLLKDLEVKNDEGNAIIIDRNKVRRERAANRLRLTKLNQISENPKAFSFDGRKDLTLTENVTPDGKLHPRIVRETHIVILKQPDSVFLGYAVVDDHAKAPQIAGILLQFFKDKKVDLSNLIGICSDGEAKNTGRRTGIIRSLEVELGRPLHWFICLLHFNELPFRHLLEKIDSSLTTGPRTSTGIITKSIENVDKPVCMTFTFNC